MPQLNGEITPPANMSPEVKVQGPDVTWRLAVPPQPPGIFVIVPVALPPERVSSIDPPLAVWLETVAAEFSIVTPTEKAGQVLAVIVPLVRVNVDGRLLDCCEEQSLEQVVVVSPLAA
ncbi:MAG: hypothetical protein HY539_06580 [Deltaproteobacteria bacterium]|nr:hypothetical protein [Deltaproteobacteria bacterium]